MRHRLQPIRFSVVPWLTRTWASRSAATHRHGSSSPHSPQIPLCERPPSERAAGADVRAFYEEARRAIRHDLKDGLGADGGPTMAELELELEYVMEDAVVGWKGSGENDGALFAMRMALGDVRDLCHERVSRRLPLQYLTSSAFWRDMVLSVGPGVLIPRPETELMVDFVLEAVESNPSLGRGVWADLGTGSGALAVGVARALPGAGTVYAADIAEAPLAYVAYNAARYDVGDRVRPIRSDWFDGLARELRENAASTKLAGVVSNPPYIPSPTCATLQAEVKDHEPVLALDGGGALAVDCLVPICRGAAEMLVDGGFLALETNGGEQAHWIVEFLEEHGFTDVRIRRDLRRVDRFVTATKR